MREREKRGGGGGGRRVEGEQSSTQLHNSWQTRTAPSLAKPIERFINIVTPQNIRLVQLGRWWPHCTSVHPCPSPWYTYNRTGWLGVKRQCTYLLTYHLCPQHQRGVPSRPEGLHGGRGHQRAMEAADRRLLAVQVGGGAAGHQGRAERSTRHHLPAGWVSALDLQVV